MTNSVLMLQHIYNIVQTRIEITSEEFTENLLDIQYFKEDSIYHLHVTEIDDTLYFDPQNGTMQIYTSLVDITLLLQRTRVIGGWE